jgi:hypothetical protein
MLTFVQFQDQLFRDHLPARAAPHVVYAQLKFLWANGERTHSIERLRNFADELSRDLDGRRERHPSQALSPSKIGELSQLLAKCYLKLGEWQYEIEQNWKDMVGFRVSHLPSPVSHPQAECSK